MNRDEWQNKRRTKDVLGANVLQKTIDDYEVKLCDNHTKILNLEHDLKSVKEQIEEQKKETSKQKREASRNWDWYKKEEKKGDIIKEEAKLLLENSNTKWFQRSTRKKIIEKVEHFIRWGY